MNKYIFTLSLAGLLLIASSCHWSPKDENVGVKSLYGWGEYPENLNFPINGYYYCDIKNFKHHDMINTDYDWNIRREYVALIFYRNGIYSQNVYFADSLKQLDNIIENNITYNQLPTNDSIKYGSFQISKDSLLLYSLAFQMRSKARKKIYKILNNKELYEVGFYYKKNIIVFNSTDSAWRFRPLSHKPDSTNELMENEYLKVRMRNGYEEYLKRIGEKR